MSANVETVERVIEAPPEEIFGLLADPSRHREIDGSGTVRDSTEGSRKLKLGSRFGMSMQAGIPYTMVSTVVEFEPNRRIAWQTRPSFAPLGLFVGGRIWRYELEPVDGGTLVRESWDISKERVKPAMWPLRSSTRKSMEATLARIDALLTGH
jgi:uncharacterized protein YndB with AHSA1/START domain